METAADPTDIGRVVDNMLPDERVLNDVSLILQEEKGSEGTDIEFETGHVRVPENPHVAIVTKAYLKEYYDSSFAQIWASSRNAPSGREEGKYACRGNGCRPGRPSRRCLVAGGAGPQHARPPACRQAASVSRRPCPSR
jgi:hypothetical protein